MHNILTRRIPQAPQCFGRNVDRLIFNIKLPGADTSLILGHAHGRQKFSLDAGAAHGIQPDSRVAIYESNLLSNLDLSLGILGVADVKAFSSTLTRIPGTPSFKIPKEFFARELGSTIRVFSEQRTRLEKSLTSGLSELKDSRHGSYYSTIESAGIIISDRVDDADVKVVYEDVQDQHRVFFERHEDYGTPFIDSRFPYSLPADDSKGILRIVMSTARYNRYLNTTNANSHLPENKDRKSVV